MSAGLLLVGASGLAREVLAAGIADVVGILDDDPSLRDGHVGGIPVVGPTALARERSEKLLVCIGPSTARRAVVARLQAAAVEDERFETFIAASARIGSSSTVGRGSIVLDGVVVTADASVGRHAVIMPNTTVAHDDVLGDFVTLASGVSLAGGVQIGEAAYIGMNASVRQGVVIGARATIGMAAAVLSDVPGEETWAGVPARALGKRT